MKALTYHGSNDVRVENVPDPKLANDDDILLRVTATAICGSDMHIYRGKFPGMETGDILGHEFMGIVEDTGGAVTRVRRGDRVVVPFTISCGDCFFCSRKLFSACETTNPDRGTIMNKKDTRPGAGALRLQPLLRWLLRRPGRVRSGSEGERRAARDPRFDARRREGALSL
jgi:threonine dehydrogenase-like Zn-dependent dehydrogenase